MEVTLEPSLVARGESDSSCAKRLWRGCRAGRGPWGGEGTPGSTDTPRLARTSRRGGRSSCAAVAWPGALARVSSLLRGRGEARELLCAGAYSPLLVLWCARLVPGGAGARARRSRGGRTQGLKHKSTVMGIRRLACCVWFRCCPLVPVPVSCLQEAARHRRPGVEARAGRMGSGGRPRRKRRHAGAGPVAVARGCGRSSRWLAVALSAPQSGVGGRAGGGRVLQAKLRGARAQACRRALWGPPAGRGTSGWQEALLAG